LTTILLFLSEDYYCHKNNSCSLVLPPLNYCKKGITAQGNWIFPSCCFSLLALHYSNLLPGYAINLTSIATTQKRRSQCQGKTTVSRCAAQRYQDLWFLEG